MAVLPKVGSSYLNQSLPYGWQKYFHAQKAGRYWGLSITCPVCNTRPPKEVRPWQRWRWLASHTAMEHAIHATRE